MSGRIEFSVVIPSFNRKHVIRRAVDSALAQTVPALEVIVVDDGSTDGTSEFLELRYGHVSSFRCLRQENMGVGRARNRGVEEATAEWVVFLDSDDEWYPFRLLRISEALRGEAGLDGLGTGMAMDTGTEGDAPVDGDPVVEPYTLDRLLLQHGVSCCLAVRRDVFRALGGFALNFCEDHDLVLRMLAGGHRFGILREELGIVHTEDSGQGVEPREWYRRLLRFWKGQYERYELRGRSRRRALASLYFDASLGMREKGLAGPSLVFLLKSLLQVPQPATLVRYGRWIRHKRLLWLLSHPFATTGEEMS
ncbi:MAG: glycosyltransferase family 2 protein [Lentisphaerae bacterium]|nr:glycosyltransferase family 2 protein [Lentisphaerota bacterium]